MSAKRCNMLQKNQQDSSEVRSEEEADKVYIVERILNHKTVKGKRMALIKWKGYPASDSTWEPEDAIFDLHAAWKKTAEQSCDVFTPSGNCPQEWENVDHSFSKQEEKSDVETETSPKHFVTKRKRRLKLPTLGDPLDRIKGEHATIMRPTVIIPPLMPTQMEKALKLYMFPKFKPIDRWSTEDLRNVLIDGNYFEKAERFYNKEIDEIALKTLASASCALILHKFGIAKEETQFGSLE